MNKLFHASPMRDENLRIGFFCVQEYACKCF